MKGVKQDLMYYDAIAIMKYGMTVTEAKKKGVCIECRRIVQFVDRDYDNFALCRECKVKCTET